MKKSILNRYERTESGAVILDVAATRVADLYENIDKVSPFVKKDLDPRLTEYLKDGAEDIGNEPFVIRLTLNEAPSDELKIRVSTSIANIFTYMIDVERRGMRKMARMSLYLCIAGLSFLALATVLSDWLSSSEYALVHVFPHGITVAGWVSLWHAIATFLIDWGPRRTDIQHYRHLSSAPILFETAV
jgi:hypothetical protein